MREKMENAVLRSLMKFKKNFERGQLNFGRASHTVKMNEMMSLKWASLYTGAIAPGTADQSNCSCRVLLSCFIYVSSYICM